jgi:Trk K+ transport system NAD-binding subunit
VSEKIPPGAKAAGLRIQDMPLPRNCVLTAILRGGEIVIPRGSVKVEAGDEVLALVDAEAAEELAVLFGRPEGSSPPRA